MSKETNQDMGTGSVKKLMVQMAVPAVVGQVINLLYNVVDRIYIGHIPEIGGAALTGVGLFTPILMLITAFAMLAGAGGAPRAAIAMGKGDRDTAEKIVANCFTVLLLLAVVLTGVFYGTLPTLVRLFGGSDVTLPYAVQYGRIYVLGSVFVLVVMGMNPFITTQGFAGTSMLTTVIGAVINIVLDPIFIFVFDMGVAGAAIATVLSQAVSAVWILRFLTGRKTILRLHGPKAETAPALSGAGDFQLRHGLHGEHSLRQLHLLPVPVRRRRGRGRHDGADLRQPADHHAPAGHLPGRPAADQLQLRRAECG